MAKIYRATDLVTVKIDDVTVKLAPLTLHQKTEVQAAMIAGREQTSIREATRGIAMALKYALKDMQGVVDADNNPYKLAFDNKELTEECIDDLMNMELSAKLSMVCAQMVSGVPDTFTDAKNNPLEGVEVVQSNPIKNR